jgi:hypothetical protein
MQVGNDKRDADKVVCRKGDLPLERQLDTVQDHENEEGHKDADVKKVEDVALGIAKVLWRRAGCPVRRDDGSRISVMCGALLTEGSGRRR